MTPTTITYEFPFEFSEQKETEMSAVEIEEQEYAAFASLLGITPSAPRRPSADGERVVRIDAAEVAELRRLAALKDTAAEGDDDRFYAANRLMILGAGR